MQSQAKDEGPRSFTRFFENVAEGCANVDAAVELQQLVGKLKEHAVATRDVAKGELTIKLSFKCDDTGVVGVGYDIKTKEPPKRRRASVFWTTAGNNLTVDNPRQQELPLRAVDTPSETRQAPGETEARTV